MSVNGEKPRPPHGRPLALDLLAESGSQTEPAFLARPEGAPVYHGFKILDDVVVQGFALGKITDFDAEICDESDSFVVAPDGSRAGLVWKVSGEPYFAEILPLERERWGVWDVSFPYPMTNHDNARKNLEVVVQEFRRRWELWRRSTFKIENKG